MKTKLLLLAACCFILAGSPATFVGDIIAQTDTTNFWRQSTNGPHVHGFFEGRSPCQEIVRLLNAPGKEACIKIKWGLILYRDPKTHTPTTYALGGFAWRNPPKTGKWAVVKGTKEDPDAAVYQLDPDTPQGFLSFLKADDNILLFLDRDRNFLVGNERFSYTLNRVSRP